MEKGHGSRLCNMIVMEGGIKRHHHANDAQPLDVPTTHNDEIAARNQFNHDGTPTRRGRIPLYRGQCQVLLTIKAPARLSPSLSSKRRVEKRTSENCCQKAAYDAIAPFQAQVSQ